MKIKLFHNLFCQPCHRKKLRSFGNQKHRNLPRRILTVFLLFFVQASLSSLQRELLREFPFSIPLTGSGGARERGGAPFCIMLFSGGGGGIDDPISPRGIKTFVSSSSVKSRKSKSQSIRSRSMFLINSSQCISISDFLGSGFLRSLSGVALESILFLFFANSSLAFDISPDKSPTRLGFSSCGLKGKLLSFCVRSLTV